MSAELVTMHDIAALAAVARPVVSTWRRRYRTTSRPFPSPRTHHGNQELFLREEVVSWLEETERGNNPHAREEAVVGALLSEPRLATPRNLDALSALLVLRGLQGDSLAGLDADDVLDAADSADPDDTFLFRELDKADDLQWLAKAAEDLITASWTVADAHQRLLAAHLPAAMARTLLGADAIRALAALIGPLLRDLGPDAALLDATGCRFDLMADLASATEAPLNLLNGNTRSHRLNRRRLRLAQVIPTLISPEGGWSAHGPTLNLAVLPDPAHPAATESSQLTLVEDVALQLTPDQALVVLASAAVLTDPLAGEAGTRRDQLLRQGHVRAVVRLPAGMVPGRVREAMGLWLLTPVDTAAPADRRTLVADLSRRQLTAGAVDGLASDLLAARQGIEGARRRAWAHLHPVTTGSLLAAGGSLVPSRRASSAGSALRVVAPTITGADWVVRLGAAATDRLPNQRLVVSDRRLEPVSLAHAEQRGWLRVLPGRRFDAAGLVTDAPHAPVRVWDVLAIANPLRRREVDRLALHQLVEPVFTEPGDVVFVTRPRPTAVLDADGGAAVFSPVRILRVRAGKPLVPAVLAMRINAETGSDWRSWSFASLHHPDALAAAHAELAAHRARLVSELADLDRFTTDLTTAVECGQLSLTTKEHHGQAHN